MSLFRITAKEHTIFFVGILILTVITVIFVSKNAVGSKNRNNYFESLQKRLVEDGLDKHRISELYKRPEVYFETKGVSRFLVHREASLNYHQFTSKKSIRNALKYMEQHQQILELTEKAYGVDKEVITAIILVETRLGILLGGPSVLNTLSTMAALADPDVRNMFWGKVSKSSRLTREQFDKWVKRKSSWAYKELKAFLKYTAKENMDPAAVSGSYSGALGIGQFMPTNILAFAQDGDNNDSIDVFNHSDAIASIANYLKHYGWYPGIDGKKAYKVIYHYNHSRQYVDTILKVSALLKSKA
ncbi:MAG: lytic murein transglycosylase [Deltaproteobacteria bacterium]|jgi:membrane-bound lytic murein transglycosylase B|nr:lytic murein transglycosylase [Deltaproteobacteria bacterium]MBW2491491.1 lytic murein transglycosylase [Deltaproteobacteria bacterium]